MTSAAGLDLSVGGYPGITFSLGKDLVGASMAIVAGDHISMGTATDCFGGIAVTALTKQAVDSVRSRLYWVRKILDFGMATFTAQGIMNRSFG